MNRLLPLFVAAALLVACSKVTAENYGKLEAGMDRQAVYALLGQPDEVSGGGIGGLTMSSESWTGGGKTIRVTFAGDTLATKSIGPTESNP